MTFGIAFAGLDYLGIVSDRRVSGADADDDDAGKCGAVVFIDGLFAYTSAGLARVPSRGFRAREWIAESLMRSGHGPSSSLVSLFKFGLLAGEKMRDLVSPPPGALRVKLEDCKSSFLFAGYIATPEGRIRVISLTSNFEGPRAVFSKTELDFTTEGKQVPDGEVAIMCIGNGRHYLEPGELAGLRKMLANPKVPSSETVQAAVRLVQEVAKRDPGGLVGGRCSSVVIDGPRSDRPLSMDYFPDGALLKAQSPDFVCACYDERGAYLIVDAAFEGGNGSFEDVATDSASAWVPSVPKQRKNERCLCGSGKKYKSCHGKSRRSGTDSIFSTMKFSVPYPPTVEQVVSETENVNGEISGSVIITAADPVSGKSRLGFRDAAGALFWTTPELH